MNTRERLDYKEQLNTLRFLAFLCVFFFHAGFQPGGKPFPYGNYGVDIFFALSGFLITRLVLLTEQGQTWRDLAIFYARRVLRIFPLYYFVLIVLFELRRLPYPAWHFFYIWNIKQFLTGKWFDDLSHLWSLCVEEQFYLTFPPLLLFTAKFRRPFLIVGLIILTFVTDCICYTVMPHRLYMILLPVRGQALLWGCLAGYIELQKWSKDLNGTAVLLLGIVFHLFTLACLATGDLSYFGTPCVYLSYAIIVFGLWRTVNPIILGIFTLAPLVYLGRISYGLYIFHNFSWTIRSWLLERIPQLSIIDPCICYFLITLILAVLSWHLLETPMNRLKRLFPYQVKKEAAG
jgi:peptidoglycan/LPS O-acetylase OafA/YrhL